MRFGTYDIYDNHFNLLAPNGKVILTSETYETMQGLLGGVRSVRKNAGEDSGYKLLTATDDRYYFNLQARNNKIIGTSQMYKYKFTRWIGIMSVKRNGWKAINRTRG